MTAPQRHLHEFDDALPEDDLDVWQIVLSLWQAKWLIAAVTVTAGTVAAIASSFVPATYQATATVFVTPPTFVSELKSPPLSVEAYARLAESDFVRDLVQEEVRTTNALGASDRFGALRTVLYSSREPGKPYLPLVGLVAESSSAEGAQKIANTWALRFVEEQRRLSAQSTAGSADFVVEQFPKAEQALGEAQAAYQVLARRQAAELSKAELDANVSLKKATLTAQETSIVELEGRIVETRIELQESKQRLAQLERELKATPQHTIVAKAITDDALWQRIGQGEPGASLPPELLRQRLETQEINPVYTYLASDLAQERVDANALAAVEQELTQQLARAKISAAETRRDLFESEARIADLKSRHSEESARLERRVDEARAKFTPFSERIGEAQIARAQTEPDVKLGALAARPGGPVRPNHTLNVLAATAAGFLLSLIGVWVLQHAAADRRSAEKTETTEKTLIAELMR